VILNASHSAATFYRMVSFGWLDTRALLVSGVNTFPRHTLFLDGGRHQAVG
jgi:hypothetical protein